MLQMLADMTATETSLVSALSALAGAAATLLTQYARSRVFPAVTPLSSPAPASLGAPPGLPAGQADACVQHSNRLTAVETTIGSMQGEVFRRLGTLEAEMRSASMLIAALATKAGVSIAPAAT